MGWGRAVMTVGAIIRSGDKILMVREMGSEGEPTWTLPGGVVEPGELLHEALIREVREETGLEVFDLGPVAYSCQHFLTTFDDSLIATAFEVKGSIGDLAAQDPDGLVLDAAWQPVAEVGSLIDRHIEPRWRPLLAYLSGEVPPGSMWFWRIEEDGSSRLEAMLRGHEQTPGR